MRILLTGATGFLGGHAARRLAEQMRVRCLVRSLARAASLNHPQIETVQGDLTNPASLEAAVAGVEVVILRPPMIFGPGSRWTHQLLQNARKGRLMLPAGGQFPFPCVYVENMVDAIAAAIQAPAAQGVYNIFDVVPTYAEYVQPFLDAAGQRPRVLPYPLLWTVAAMSELYGRLTGRYMVLNRRTVRAMAGRESRGAYSREKARRELGWEPRVPLAEAMRLSLAGGQQHL